MFRRRTAAAADDIDVTVARPVGDFGGKLLGRLVVTAEGVGQPGVGVRRNEAVTQAGEGFHMRAQVFRAERTVKTERQRLYVAKRIPEGFRRLSRKRAPGRVGNCPRNHHRPAPASVLEEAFQGKERCLGVERIKDGFDEQEVGAAFRQPADGFGIGGNQFVEADVAVAGVVHVRRDGCRARGRPQYAGDKARLGRVAGGEFVADFARQACAGKIEFINQCLQSVIGL